MGFLETNDTVASERSIFSDSQDYKNVLHVAVNPYVRTSISGFRC